MRHEWTPPEALYAGQPACFVEGPLGGLVLSRHEASVQQLAHEILRLVDGIDTAIDQLQTRDVAPGVVLFLRRLRGNQEG